METLKHKRSSQAQDSLNERHACMLVPLFLHFHRVNELRERQRNVDLWMLGRSTPVLDVTLLVQIPFCISFFRWKVTQTALVLCCVFSPGLHVRYQKKCSVKPQRFWRAVQNYLEYWRNGLRNDTIKQR